MKVHLKIWKHFLGCSFLFSELLKLNKIFRAFFNGTKLCIVVNPGNDISNPVGGTIIFDANGAAPKSSQCEGTAVTVIRY